MLGAPSGLDTFLQYAGAFLQMLYFLAWAVVAVAAIWAVLVFKRYVDYVTGGKRPDKGVSVEKFVD